MRNLGVALLIVRLIKAYLRHNAKMTLHESRLKNSCCLSYTRTKVQTMVFVFAKIQHTRYRLSISYTRMLKMVSIWVHCSPIFCQVWLKADEFLVVAQTILTIHDIKLFLDQFPFSGKQITDSLFERSMATTTCLSAMIRKWSTQKIIPRWGKLNRRSGTYTKIHVTYRTCKPSEQLFAN